MEFEMTAVFHYGKDSEKHIRRFQEKRLDYATRDLYNYSADQLRALLNTIFNEKLQNLIDNDETETEYRETKKAIERTKTEIAVQVRNMREAGDSLRKFIEDDIAEMTKDLDRLENDLARIQESKVDR